MSLQRLLLLSAIALGAAYIVTIPLLLRGFIGAGTILLVLAALIVLAALVGVSSSLIAIRRIMPPNKWSNIAVPGISAAITASVQGVVNTELLARLYPIPESAVSLGSHYGIEFVIVPIVAIAGGAMIGQIAGKVRQPRAHDPQSPASMPDRLTP